MRSTSWHLELWSGMRPADRALRSLLRPASWIYGAVVAARSALYDRGVLSVQRVSVPVVGVGNLSVGGTGKTPLVLWLVDRLRERGLRCTVVSRGYGGAGRRPVAVVPQAVRPPLGGERGDQRALRIDIRDSGEICGPADAASDEALLVALRGRVPVLSAADRVVAARLAVAWFSPDVIVLDDGFQHRRLHRDLDIVLLSSDDRRAALLPAGRLREPLSALERADVVLEAGEADDCSSACRFTKRATGLVRWPAERVPFSQGSVLSGRRIFAFAGIGQPASFFDALSRFSPARIQTAVFADHHRYTRRDWERIVGLAADCDWLVTTEKDLVKLAGLGRTEQRLVALRVEAQLSAGGPLLERLEQLDAQRRRPHDREIRATEGRQGE